MMIRRISSTAMWACCLTCFSLIPSVQAEVLQLEFFVREGQLETVDERSLPVLCFASSEIGPAFLPNAEIDLELGDELHLTLHNQDDALHGFEVVGIGGGETMVAPGESETFVFVFPEVGCWLYRDPVNAPVNQGLGLAGAIVVTDPDSDYDGEFLWLLDEFSEDWLVTHDSGGVVDDAVYLPNYFTVNGLSGTDTLADARATITGRIGDSLLIHAVNGGLRLHSIHFHGYHVDVLWRDGQALPAPWTKDTVAIPAGGTALLRLVPLQDGLFPIHDHVVQSVTGNGVYPLGMIVFADIQP